MVHYSNYTPYIKNKLLPAKEADFTQNISNQNINYKRK